MKCCDENKKLLLVVAIVKIVCLRTFVWLPFFAIASLPVQIQSSKISCHNCQRFLFIMHLLHSQHLFFTVMSVSLLLR